ncbi:hypothetical protein OG689_43680 [Kitasatospora sp. NBC_00240]|uniref:hypothetical protein n=1 Tax=Kitasatospora sp. NBC_00240 TaxID=2903567 RepID=UPI00225A066B|nr:hypothetical protein [Kitasatospora sp. NBC_00240]MCX5216037.1 hypothetical protein [Kitasatospora sp. NBC_00240]
MPGNNSAWDLPGVPASVTFDVISKDTTRLKAHVQKRGEEGEQLASELDELDELELLANVRSTTSVSGTFATDLDAWLVRALPVIEEGDSTADGQFDRISAAARLNTIYGHARDVLLARTPVFVHYSQIFTVRPRIHLANLAQHQATKRYR